MLHNLNFIIGYKDTIALGDATCAQRTEWCTYKELNQWRGDHYIYVSLVCYFCNCSSKLTVAFVSHVQVILGYTGLL